MIALALGVLIACAVVSGVPGPRPGPNPGPFARPYPGPIPAPSPTIGNRGSASHVFGYGAGYPPAPCPLGYNCDVGGCPAFLEPYAVIEGFPYPGLPYY